MSDISTLQNKEEIQKKSAVQFLQFIVNGQVEKAYQEFVNFKGKHHNPFFPAGFSDLKKGMLENNNEYPNKQIQIQHVIADNDLVAVHSHLIFNSEEAGMATFHLFRFQDGKIVEFWDCGQQIPNDSPNMDGAF